MSSDQVICFGEILWDCLPRGLFLGGAPLNVACHLAQMGFDARLVSAVGNDFLGDEALRRIQTHGVLTDRIFQHPTLPTGVVIAELDSDGNAHYEFAQPVAWDEIRIKDDPAVLMSSARAIVFGSLALRSKSNLRALQTILEEDGPLKCFDINLRPPFDDLDLVRKLARTVDLLKLNETELARLVDVSPTSDRFIVADRCEMFAAQSGVRQICVTLGADGALFWQPDDLHFAPAPKVNVRDTVGAGDAFMATLVAGLAIGQPIPDVLAEACAHGAKVAAQDGAI